MTEIPKKPQVLISMSDALYNDLKETASRAGMTSADYARHAIMWALYGAEPREVVE